MKTTRQNRSFRHPSRSARIAQYLGGDTLVTRTEKRPGNNFDIKTASGSTEFTMQLKNGTVVSLNGHDSRAVLRVLLRHYGYMATGQGVGSDLSFTVEGLTMRISRFISLFLIALFSCFSVLAPSACSIEQTGGGFGGSLGHAGSAGVTAVPSGSASSGGAGGAAPVGSGGSGGQLGAPVASSDEGGVCPMPGLSCPDPAALLSAR
jgi:hypothetical protein